MRDAATGRESLNDARCGDAVRVLRDTTGLLHTAENGVPVCAYDGDVIDALHPIDRLGIWCQPCINVIVARYPRKERDLRG